MYKKLFSPVAIGSLNLKNRLVMSPMCSGFGDGSGMVSQRLVDYFDARARGGVGMIIVGITFVHPQGRLNVNQLSIASDDCISGLRRLTEVVHTQGAKIVIQLHHGGNACKSKITNRIPVAPSAIPFGGAAATGAMAGLGGEIPQPLSLAEISELVAYYTEAAARAQTAGFDGVELHAAHGYLLDQFLSRSSNRRTDRYGGSLVNRARILVEIIQSIKAKLGAPYPVWCRINGREFGVEGGTTIDDAKRIAMLIQEAGADAVHVTAVGPTSPINLTTPTFEPAVIADLAAGIKSAVSIPVITVGKMTPETGERMLAEKKADLISIGRGHLADPAYARKLAEGRPEDITPCILCMKCRDDILDVFSVDGIRCSVNAALGREREFAIEPAKRSRKVLVVGGGPGGLEAARVSALRGHEVTLWDRGTELGGQLIWAGRAPHKDRIEVFRQYLIRQVAQAGVLIETEVEATPEKIEKFAPDALVLATGGVPYVPDIPGLSEADSFQSMAFLRKEADPGQKVLVTGGGLVGCEVAEMLAEEGRQVTLIDVLPEIACTLGPSLRRACIDRLASKRVEMLPNIRIERIEADKAVLSTEEGDHKIVTFDSILLATGFRPDIAIYERITVLLPDAQRVGDCIEPRSIREAVAEGYEAGLRI